LVASEDVGDIGAMLILALTKGFGRSGSMPYLFTYENQTQYAVLKAMGATSRVVPCMILCSR
jgi:putative ABC transport system permease protein